MTAPVSDTANTAAAPTAPAIAIVADDLTGATDSAVQFAANGWATRLHTSSASEALVPGHVMSSISDARAMADAEARSRTADLVDSAIRSGADRLFLKIDSTMRGSVAAQVGGALDAWRRIRPEAIAVVCPAYPAMGRTVDSAVIAVDGVPVHETWIGTDPVTPVTSSSLRDLLPGSVHARCANELEAAIRAAAATSGVVTVDAQHDADLDDIARAVAELGSRALPVGAAGLASAMASAWGPRDLPSPVADRLAERVVVVASSLHEVTNAQLEALLESHPEALLLAPPVDALLDSARAQRWIAGAVPAHDEPPVIVLRTPEERAAAVLPDGSRASSTISRNLAVICAAVVRRVRPDALVLMGGEGARASLAELGATGVRIHRAVKEGIPLGTLEGGVAHGIGIVTKAGGFGAPGDVADIVDELLTPHRKGTSS